MQHEATLEPEPAVPLPVEEEMAEEATVEVDDDELHRMSGKLLTAESAADEALAALAAAEAKKAAQAALLLELRDRVAELEAALAAALVREEAVEAARMNAIKKVAGRGIASHRQD